MFFFNINFTADKYEFDVQTEDRYVWIVVNDYFDMSRDQEVGVVDGFGEYVTFYNESNLGFWVKTGSYTISRVQV